MNKFSRRDFLRLGGVGLLTPYHLLGEAANSPFDFIFGSAPKTVFQIDNQQNSNAIFDLSVASGDPTPTGVILWTRINPAYYLPSEPLAFEVALDLNFNQIIAQGIVNGEELTVDRDFTVKVDLDGRLSSNQFFYYRFIYRHTASRTGRCRTLARPGDSSESVKFAVLSCQDFSAGYYGAFSHLSKETDVDFVIHLGDFIYESAGGSNENFEDRLITFPNGNPVAFGLEDYRRLFRAYRSDPFLQQAMEQHTWISIWDDHETANDCYWDYDRDTLGAPDHPFSNLPEFGNDPNRLRQLKCGSQQAWAEYTPARVAVSFGADHPHQFLQIFRKFQFGDLVELFMTDERTYRSSHPCGEKTIGDRYASLGCSEQLNGNRTMLGLNQRDWLVQGMTTSEAIWKVWGNEVFQAPLRLTQTARSFYIDLDAWDGYLSERAFLAKRFQQAKLRNLIVLTGDLHASIASYLKSNYTIDPFNLIQANMIGVEFMTPALTSANFGQSLSALKIPMEISEFAVKLTNPHIRFFNDSAWGYSTVEFTAQYCEFTVFAIDKSINREDVSKRILKRLRTPVNKVKIQEV